MRLIKLLSSLLLVVNLAWIIPAQAAPAQAGKINWKTIRELDFATTLYYFFQREYFTAIVYLTASQQKDVIQYHEHEAQILLGGMYLSFGMHREAGEMFDRLTADQIPQSVRDRAWFYLAKIRYQRDLFPEAEAAIRHIEGTLASEDLERERQVLHANILLAQARYPEAEQILASIKESTIWTNYARYNLAVAQIRTGETESGRKILEELGSIKAPDEETQALRDQANLSLGYSYIQEEKPEPALENLRKVRLEGHLSNKALLGLGWAYDQLNEPRKALAPWMELNKRNFFDPAVQESLLATAYALGKLNADNRALEHYQTAIEIYQGEIQRLEDTITLVHTGSYLRQIMEGETQNEMGWFWEMQETPKTPESYYLLHLLASHTFQEALKNFRDVNLLITNLQRWSEDIETFDTMLTTREAAYAAQVPRIQGHVDSQQSGRLQQTREHYAQEIERIVKENDIMGLANTSESIQLNKIRRIEERLDKLSAQRNLDEAREKYRLVKGALYWNIASNYGPRLWDLRKSLKELDDALQDHNHLTQNLAQRKDHTPSDFTDYKSRIDLMRGQIRHLQQQAMGTLNAQEKLLEDLAIHELREQQQRISSYLTHAQFSMAQIQDRAAHKEDKP